jgi:hypothetical protein
MVKKLGFDVTIDREDGTRNMRLALR